MNVGSICTGYGGLDLAVEHHYAGKTVWVADPGADQSTVLACRYPHAPNLGDITGVDWAAVEPVDIVTAGYPCQPFSTAGQRRGAADDRHLWPEVLRAVRALRPRRVVLENVAGHLSLGFDQVLGDLAEAGFDAEWCVLRASDVGAPHRRARLFIVAAPHTDGAGRGPVGPKCPEPGPSAIAASPGETRPRGRGRSTADTDGEPAGRHSRTDARPETGDGGRPPVDGDRPADGRRTPPGADVAGGETRVRRSRGGDARRSQPVECGGPDWGAYTAAVQRWGHTIGRAAPPPLHPDNPKQLHARFVEWMMGLDDGWVTDLIPNRRALAVLGNGVVPQQAAAALTVLEAAA